MLKACLFGSAVTFALVAIPGVHFITGIPSAFVGGYIAGSRAEATPGQALVIALLMALVLVGPIFGVFFAWFVGFLGVSAGFVWLLTGALSVWIFLLGSLGAVIGGNSVRQQQAASGL